MILERFEVRGLAHYSYIVGCKKTNEVAVVDPKRDIDTYLTYVKENNLKIVKVLETHIHADYASGAEALAKSTGATLSLSKYDMNEIYEVRAEHEKLSDGQEFKIGSLKFKVIHTPGHTPEHISFLVESVDDEREKSERKILLSGDFLFVGSVGRPDLLGEDNKVSLAGLMFESVKKISNLHDNVEIYPAHGAGSMCGSGLGKEPSSTLGNERESNPYFNQNLTKDDFIELLLTDPPPLPPYYIKMKELNSRGADILKEIPGVLPLSIDKFKELRRNGAVVIDLRDVKSYNNSHIPSSLSLGVSPQFVVWASWILDNETPIIFLAEKPSDVEPAGRALIQVGIDKATGYLEGGINAWINSGEKTSKIELTPVAKLKEMLDSGEALNIYDVRAKTEWSSGHISNSINMPLNTLTADIKNIKDKSKPIAVMCAGGYRSTIAASIFEQEGFANIINIEGGMGAWEKERYPATV